MVKWFTENTNNWRDCDNGNFGLRWCINWYHHFGKQYYLVKLSTGIAYSPGFMLLENLMLQVYTPRKYVLVLSQ